MLYLNGKPFVAGRARYSDSLQQNQGPTPKIYIKIRPLSFDSPLLAQLDTGAAWSILEAEIADDLGLFDYSGEPKSLDTRLGNYAGYLVRLPILLLADQGQSLEIDATVFVSKDWTKGNFVGYCGLLERVRIAVDPQENQFYFGSLSQA